MRNRFPGPAGGERPLTSPPKGRYVSTTPAGDFRPSGGGKPEVVLATRNPGKKREILSILGDLEVCFSSLSDYPDIGELPPEGEDMRENARLKAVVTARATGKVALADDSGLEVEALGGIPGALSARFAGEGASYEDNNRKLLGLLRDVPDEKRRARFRCIMCLATPQGKTVFAEGTCQGIITQEPRGNGGFGYDPLFCFPERGQSFAEIGEEEKNRVSHRYHALTGIRAQMGRVLGLGTS